MKLLKIINQPHHLRYGELVLLDDAGHTLYDIVYDGQGHYNFPSRLDSDYRTAKSEFYTYGVQALKHYLDYLQSKYNTKVINNKEVCCE